MREQLERAGLNMDVTININEIRFLSFATRPYHFHIYLAALGSNYRHGVLQTLFLRFGCDLLTHRFVFCHGSYSTRCASRTLGSGYMEA